MGQIRVVLIFNEDNERQKEIGEYLKSQKRCKTALITELVYAWLHKEHKGASWVRMGCDFPRGNTMEVS